MNNTLHNKRLALFLSAFFVIFLQVLNAQNNLMELKPGAEKLIYFKETGEHRLIGKININYQSNIIYCDSASYFDNKQLIKAYGHVHLNKHDTLNLYCDSLHYNGNTRIAKLWGNVKIRDNVYKITTDSLDYDSKKEIAIYRNFGKIENNNNKEYLTSLRGYFYPKTKNITVAKNVEFHGATTKMYTDSMKYNSAKKKVTFLTKTSVYQTDSTELFCNRGWFFTNSEEALLEGNAKIIKPKQHIFGDTLYYNPKNKSAFGKGNITYSETKKGISFTGNRFSQSKLENKNYLTGNAIFSYQLKDDTLHIHADTLFTFTDSTDQINKVKAYHNTRIYSHKTQGVCDSLIFTKKTINEIELLKKPILWNKNTELKGDTIRLYLKDTIMQYATIAPNSNAIMEVDTGNYYNQIAGKKMIAYFDTLNNLKQIHVQGNAQTIYFPEESLKKDSIIEIQRKGMNRLYASEIKVHIDSNEFKKVIYIDQADGLMYPMNAINKEEQFIPGFSWNPFLRPKSKSDLLRKTNSSSIKNKGKAK